MRSLLLILLVGILLPVFLVRTGIYFRWVHAQYDKEMQSNLEMARAAAMAFDTYVKDLAHQEYTMGSALVSLVSPESREATKFLVVSASQYPAVRGFHWINLDGTIINSSNPRYLGLNIADRLHFRQALHSKTFVISDLLTSKLDGLPIFVVAHSIPDSTGRIAGVVAAVIYPDQLEQELFKHERRSIGVVTIADRQGHIVCSNPYTTLDAQHHPLVQDPLYRQALDGKEAMGITYSRILNARAAMAYVPIASFGWVAGAGVPASQVLAPLREDIIITGLTSLVIVVGAVGLAVMVHRRISRGLRGLQTHAAALARGDLGHDPEVAGISELQSLADAFTRSAEQQAQAEQALRDSEEKFRNLAEHSQAIIGIVQGRRFLYANPYLSAISGYSREELMDLDIAQLIHPSYRDVVLERARQRQTGLAAPDHYEFTMVTKDGRDICLDFSPTTISYKGRTAIIGIAYDITDRKHAEQQLKTLNETLEQQVAERTAVAEQRAAQLQAMANELTQTEERERRRLAQMLHDDLQQLLAATKFHAGVLQGRLKDDITRQRLQIMVDLLDQSIKASRSLTTELSPPILYDAGLAPALTWLGRWMQTKHGLAVAVRADETVDPLTEQVRVFLFQASRELLFNVVKHAHVQQAQLEMTRQDAHVRIVVSDQGVGFDPAAVKPMGGPGGFGLFSIQERIELLGGWMEIQTAPGQGAKITLWAPLQPPGKSQDRHVLTQDHTDAA